MTREVSGARCFGFDGGGRLLVLLCRLALLCLLALSACGGGREPAATGQRIQCGGEERVLIDCAASRALRDQVIQVNAGLTQIGLGFEGKYETQALEQVRESTEHLAIGLESICRDYNACVIDRERYLGETSRIREMLSRHLRLADQRRESNAPELGDQLWSNARPDLARSRLKLAYRVEVRDGAAFRAHRSGEALRTGDEVRFVIELNRSAFVYVLLLSSQGMPVRLFPLSEQGLDNPLAAERQVVLPPPERLRLQLDAVPGTEHLQIVASVTPLEALSRAFAPMLPGAKAAGESRPQVLEAVGQLLCPSSSGASSMETSATSVRCSGRLYRGFQLVAPASEGTASEGVVLAAQPNDDVVVFQHEIVHL